MPRLSRYVPVIAATAAAALAIAACEIGSDPLSGAGASEEAIVIGSQEYYSNEIIAEIYAQALEEAGYPVERQFRIGQREVYLPEIEAGAIDLFPEYTGPLLQYWSPDTQDRREEDVYPALVDAAPSDLRILDASPATDQDAYVVSKDFSEKYGVTSVADLADVPHALTLGGNSEGAERPIGPRGLSEVYGVSVDFTPVEDGGGPLTVKALTDGDIDLAVLYTGSPSLSDEDLVQLEDPKGLLLSSHVVPLASEKIDDQAAEIINDISAELTPEGLLELNTRSVEEQSSAGNLAAEWLEEHLE
ncbi:glycine/betaine ABC transporter [Brachybacterium ginsengisoli]|uniref:Glycine/betaine ABC transporter n=1 Tax=Brachybacterium ginsengisoli TaxID=1331682 RepID=A0A291GV06_9MICO|nr:ABC transporter substrate-binding protein [Brachybacterium ginsengisoli]ATG54039.1 glycine/betaine ABC transporter [Brachybacterium ginsengisoli]